MFWGLLSIYQIFEPTLTIFKGIGQYFSVLKGQIMSKLSFNLVTLSCQYIRATAT